MSRIPPGIHHLAQQLLASEPARVGPLNGPARAVERLRAPLMKLVGTAGFSSLLCRAMALAGRQVPALEGMRQGGAVGEVEGEAALLAELLGLLVLFIGGPLTLRLVREAWPEISPELMTLSNEEKP